ncbi:uncharacterized protein LOC124274975 [Haliotis rubra]|uniref:uncharacterized protein LOC124274975 n=1 Tax=Haliotis rubra TaxID=36100 RepID=UPI001EE5E543|nr:uncharacterized protein LOC124274975 [Haliotis rubra]
MALFKVRLSSERQDKINRLVFSNNNLEEVRGAIDSVLDIFVKILTQPFQHGNYFGYKEVLDKLLKVDKNVWRDIRSKYLLDQYHDYNGGEFTASENTDPAKLLLDILSMLSKAEQSICTKLEDYEDTFRKMKDEKRTLESQLSVSEGKYMDEVQSHSIEHIELKTTLGKLAYMENLISEKNDKIAELQRYNTIELWEREKKKVLQESNAKLLEAYEELEELKRVNSSQTKKLQALEEQNRMMKLKQELKTPSGVAASQALDDVKRKNYMLEKDVMFLEEQLNNLQKTYIGVLGGIRTDLHIVGEKYRDPETNELSDEDISRMDARITFIYSKVRNAELEKCKDELLPHYLYVPQEVKLKKIRRISLHAAIPREVEAQPEQPLNTGRGRRRGFFSSADSKIDETPTPKATLPPLKCQQTMDNPTMLDPTGKFVDWAACKKHFPHMTREFLDEQWERFQEYDDNGDRSLDFSEVVGALKALGMQFTASQAQEAMWEVDVNKSETLDFYEYLLVADKIARQSGKSSLFKSTVVKTHSNVVAKTCVLQ